MRADRRDALALIGGGFAVLSGRAYAQTAPALALTASRLTQGGWARGQASPGLALDLDGAPVRSDPTGLFLIAFDRDAKPAALITGKLDGRPVARLPLTISPRAWQIENVDTPLRPPAVPSEEFQRIRAGEIAQIAEARSHKIQSDGWRQQMIRPVPGRISGRFGAQRIYRGEPGSYHTGLDLAAATGTPILAPADGVVILAAETPFTLEGKLLMIDHGMGLSSALLHCSAHKVKRGDRVAQGQSVAEVGMTGRATGPHLHWGLRWGDARLDPLLFLPEAAM
ncbi:M23 family metallopeptidase [Novosphingobium flavum]|uniref:M23 family metallopeptidase n=1 Tax=Novosphingobium flavum TaxID=1778672 RepID=A0A7X1FPS8_9SPHN|nr:M23 family metallopeptidase [Novosphingobium flavum]MBC2664599.1 M23 family metallopeptidase [Novosphingobium flavum]